MKFFLWLMAFMSMPLNATTQRLGQFGEITRFKYGPDERKAAFNIRLATSYLRALEMPANNIESENNGDENTVPYFASQFSKSFEHGPDGLLTVQGQESYRQLVKAINNGKQADFDAIVRAPGSSKLVNPQAALAFSLEGCDTCLFSIPLFPQLESAELAASMFELYLMELCRDVYFNEYGTGLNTDANGTGGSLTNDAAEVLQSLGDAFTGARNSNGVVDAGVLFRGDCPGSLIGPYTSQFAFLPTIAAIPASVGGNTLGRIGQIKLDQKWSIVNKREFGVSFEDFVALQNGLVPKKYTANDYDPVNRRYFIDGRDWASFIHVDANCESFFYAAYVLYSYNFPYCPDLPYYNNSMPNEAAFATMGMMEMFAMLENVAGDAIKAAWAQKWRANRALRPEAFGGLVQNARTSGTNPFNLNASLFVPHAGIDVLAHVQAHNALQANFPDNNLTPLQASTYLLSQVFPEGCPNHPTYTSGHATVAGACATILKAFFDNDTLIHTITTPVQPDPNDPSQLIPLVGQQADQLAVAAELDKLASNTALARNWAGIHWRQDAEQGLLLGEQVAIAYLQDRSLLYNEQSFKGYVLTKRDGTRIRIIRNQIITLN
ncbi:vanadium-dependent haloperoxidase [soil metagenome]